MADETYAIAVIGGATAGAEAAGIFARSDILTVVFEQNARPYGKVEDGLPRWHEALRNKEYAAIDGKLTLPQVHYVPDTKIGRDIPLAELIQDWGFHAVVLANGAWRDRPLPIEGADQFVDKGLVYQNAFIYWFNHYNESSYSGAQYEILDGTIVVGGGLASIDVVKVIQLELCARALAERGIKVDLVETEFGGIPKMLEKHGLEWKDLGLQGCTLYYRRRPEDMPLVDLPDGANDKVREKIAKSRARVLEKAMTKYLFNLEPQRAPVDLIIEGDRLAGLVFAKTRIENGRVVQTDETLEVRGPMIISSIGSTPETLEGIEMNGELYKFDDWDLGRLEPYPTLFSVGNVVTGKGNIVASRKHAKSVATHVTTVYLELAEEVKSREPLDEPARDALLARVQARQQAVDYPGDYASWIEAATPPDRV
jgi:NADPH-dependent glutamate synthase beta subunit-like oxidoreductase